MDSSTNVQQPFPSPPARSPASHPQLTTLANAGLSAAPQTPKTLKRSLPPGFDSPKLTGAAALADERRHHRHHQPFDSQLQKRATPSPRSSPNPAILTLNNLRYGSHQPASRPSDAPAAAMENNRPQPPPTITTSAPVAEPMSIDQGNTTTSPQSLSSADGLGQRAAHALDLRNGESQQPQQAQQTQAQAGGLSANHHEDRSNKALSYPGLPPQDHAQHDQHGAQRQMSLPNTGSVKSPTSKKHKCPHCDTEFTRHHNLKSHLLTHSQEKPYPCDQCNARFRRLHDLKRHNKLHTGERPHICDKCGRKFARGDALARHNKGPGGCAGRRSSLGEDDFAEGASGYGDGMEGVVYQDGAHPDEMENEDEFARRKSEPGHRVRRDTIHSQGTGPPSSPYRQHSSTYPGSAALAAVSRNQFAQPLPSPSHLSAASGAPSYSSQFHQLPPSNVPNGPMTESPKPLSPGQADSRRLSATNDLSNYAQGRSPSMHMHPSYARTGPVRSPPPNLPPPVSHTGPQLPSLDRLTQVPEPRHTNVQPPAGPGLPNFMAAHTGPHSASTTGSGSSNARSSGGSFREILNAGPSAPPSHATDMGLREMVKTLEARMKVMEEDMRASERHYENKLLRLKEENQKLQVENDELKQRIQRGGRP